MTDSPKFQQALQLIMAAEHPPLPWTGTGQLPWHDPEFSERMLAIHLDPETHMASRAPEVISRHTDWLLAQLEASGHRGPARVLDVGCGPGLYNHELARRGHHSVGFDFAPAPLRWAKQQADDENLAATFFDADLTDLPADLAIRHGKMDAVTFWFGEFHSFAPAVAERFLQQLAACLRPGGLFVLEYQPFELFVQQDSTEWTANEKSVFSDQPHLWLQEFAWNEPEQVEVHVHWIIEQESGTLHRYEQCHQAWDEKELVDTLAKAGCVDPAFHAPITGVSEEFEFPMLVTRRSS